MRPRSVYIIPDPVEQFAKTPSSCPSPRKLALASLHLSVAASASGCGWEKGPLNYRLTSMRGRSLTPSPIRIRFRMRILERQARQGELAGRGLG